MEFKNEFAKWLYHWLIEQGFSERAAIYTKLSILLIAVLLLALLADWVTKQFLLRLVARVSRKTKTDVDDILVSNGVFHRLAHLVPAIALEYFVDFVFADVQELVPYVDGLAKIYIVVVIMLVVNALVNAMKEILSGTILFRDKPVDSYGQLLKIINYLIGFIVIGSLLLGRSPFYLFSALGAMTAVLLLIFKDTILGFVASIQIATNDLVRTGDWITMDKYGADGDVFEINLTTIKVRNFDNTITTIPTYTFISDSFRNWRGMSESDGRRIKRSISLRIASIQFCDTATLSGYRNISLIRDFVTDKEQAVAAHNASEGVDKSEVINGRQITNLGVFRAYALAYLQANPHINQNMTCMVRQLAPTTHGVALEVYAFTKDKAWANYEGIMADIFDHLLAAVPRFGLEVFEDPTGSDFQVLGRS